MGIGSKQRMLPPDVFLPLGEQMQQRYSKMHFYFRICYTSLQTSESIPDAGLSHVYIPARFSRNSLCPVILTRAATYCELVAIRVLTVKNCQVLLDVFRYLLKDAGWLAAWCLTAFQHKQAISCHKSMKCYVGQDQHTMKQYTEPKMS